MIKNKSLLQALMVVYVSGMFTYEKNNFKLNLIIFI